MNRLVLCGCAPAALGAFDFGLLAPAGPRIAPAVGATGDAYPWLFSSSSFAYGAAVLPAALAVRRVGAAPVLALGLAATASGSGLLAAADGLAQALTARVVFGVGGALAATAALTLLGTIADVHTRRAAFAGLGAAVAVGFAGGTLLAELRDWRLVIASVAAMTACLAVVVRTAVRGDRVSSATAVETTGRARLAAVYCAGAATTAGGVGATVVLGTALADARLPGALLGAFGLAVLPGSWLARRCGPGAGLALQASGLVLVALALSSGPDPVLLLPAIVLFGSGHVAANAGVAAAVGARSVALAALLVAVQYVGSGSGPVLATAVARAHGAPAGVLTAALVTVTGVAALAAVTRRRYALRSARRRTKPGLAEPPAN